MAANALSDGGPNPSVGENLSRFVASAVDASEP